MERGRDEHDIGGTSQTGRAWRDLEVEVGYDPHAGVYYVASSDIPGLNVETTTFETLLEVALDAAPDLLDGVKEPTRINFRRTVALTPDHGR